MVRIDNKSGDSPLSFPCRFPIKAMGRDEPDFQQHVVALISRFSDNIKETDIKQTPSSKQRFTSVTVTITANSQQQLDDIYRALSDDNKVMVAL